MNITQYKAKFIKATNNKELSSEFVQKCIEYAETLLKEKLPIIYSVKHLSKLVGYDVSYIQRATHLQYQKYMYRHYKIPKKNWGKREISEPLPSLKEIQTRILTNILSNVKTSRYNKAYKKWGNIKEHVKYHEWYKKVLTLDINNFFWSIPYREIEKIFINMWYSKQISYKLARLCTLKETLAQWAPTSPYISNIYLKIFDEKISEYCKEKNINYTRYADDMAFSWKFTEQDIIDFVEKELWNLWLSLNTTKTRIMKQNTKQIISWIVVNKKKQVPKWRRNKIRNTMFYIQKFWLDNHMEKEKIKKANYLKHLLWKINYILYINPKDKEFLKYKEYLINLLK